MRILHLIHRYPPSIGGAETWCRAVAKHAVRHGHRVEVLCLTDLGPEAGEDLPRSWDDEPAGSIAGDDGTTVRRYRPSVNLGRLRNLLFQVLDGLGIGTTRILSWRFLAAILLRARDADVIHLHSLPYVHNYVGIAAARLWRRAVVITPFFHRRHPLYEAPSSIWLLRHCDLVLVLTATEAHDLVERGVARERIVEVGAGVERPRAPSVVEDVVRSDRGPRPFRLLFVGRKEQDKGLELFAEAIGVHLRSSSVEALLAGASTPWFRNFHERLPAGTRERFVDVGTPDEAAKADLLRSSDVLVLPSRFESFGLVLLEAWSYGLPVIAADVGPLPEVVGDGGLLFEADNAGQLAARISTLIERRDLREQLGACGRLRCEPWSAVGARVVRAYRRARAGSRGSDVSEQLRVLVVSDLYPPSVRGGAEISAARQVAALRRLGHRVEIFAGRLGRGTFFGDSGLHTVRLRDGHFEPGNPGRLRVRHQFENVVERFRPDVVHFHNLQALPSDLIRLAKRRSLPVVVTLHDYWGICFKTRMVSNDGTACNQSGACCLGCRLLVPGPRSLPSPVANQHHLLMLDSADLLLSPSRHLASAYVRGGLRRPRWLILPPAVASTPENSPGKTAHRSGCLYLGQLAEHKGVPCLLDAWSRLPAGLPPLHLVGSGPDRELLEARAATLGITDRCTFHGFLPHEQTRAFIRGSLFVVVPSCWPENRPLAVLEAMSEGKPVIATTMGGLPEMIDHEATGLLVPPNDPVALSKAIERLATDGDLRETLGRAAKASLADADDENQARWLSARYQELVDGDMPDDESVDRRRSTPVDLVVYSCREPWSLGLRELIEVLEDIGRRLERTFRLCRRDLIDADLATTACLTVLLDPSEEGPLGLDQPSGDILQGLKYRSRKELAAAIEGNLLHRIEGRPVAG